MMEKLESNGFAPVLLLRLAKAEVRLGRHAAARRLLRLMRAKARA
ncbi:hypothetical protein ACFQU7_29810 [Pseudoroseomonas wenyumeiae]